jgi:hypothetical protein
MSTAEGFSAEPRRPTKTAHVSLLGFRAIDRV